MATAAAPATPAPVFRLPWTAAAASLVAFTALFIREGGSVVLPVLAVGILASYVVPFRLGRRLAEFGPVLIVLILPILAENLLRTPGQTYGLFDPTKARYSGELAAAVLALECWLTRPHLGSRGVIVVPLSAAVMLAATNSFEEGVARFLTPAYILFLAPALRELVPPSEPRPAGGQPAAVRALQAAALVLTLGAGAAGYYAFHTYRSELTSWGMRLLREMPSPPTRAGLSDNPFLGPTFDQQGNLTRVLLIQGNLDMTHLHGLAFTDYDRGRWGPPRDNRAYVPADTARFLGRAAARAETARITRLVDADGVLCAPLNAAGMDLSGHPDAQWAPQDGGPLVTRVAAPSAYDVRVPANPAYQGPLCRPPTPAGRVRLLAVPGSVDARVAALAREVVAAETQPLKRARAIESYLMSHHPYSLRYHPGGGDPVSDFVLSTKGAHCEYFGSAAVIMLRCAGIPARYVVGYYAHEGEGASTMVVRQRDAHAWAEAWIDDLGWVTVDATPADGRPDQTGGAPFWTKAKEWLQDRFRSVTAFLSGPNGPPTATIAGLLAVAGLVGRWALSRRRRPRAKAGFAYSTPAAQVAELAARFEALCRRRGLVCPPGRTWQEFLAGVRPGAEGPPTLDVDQALAFVRGYNAARFGVPDAATVTALGEALRQLEA